MYTNEDDFLMLSGIQHFAFCKRQWALIHIEQLWKDNHLTIEGNWMHQKVDNPFETECNGDVVTLRSVALSSQQLELFGIADVVELHKEKVEENNILLTKYPGYWSICPIEYKHGKPKIDERDAVQLCAQAICLEEKYKIQIKYGYLFYRATRHRTTVEFSKELRKKTFSLSEEMHKIFYQGILPKATVKQECKSCSLQDECFSKEINNNLSVKQYLSKLLE